MPQKHAGRAMMRLLQIMTRLRAPDGCPWDARQTSASLKPYLLEEVHEVLEALDTGHPPAICEELGDLLLQVVFHARIYEEQNHFAMADVITAIADKLLRRHPHVFGNQPCPSDQLGAQWERIKAAEGKRPAVAGADRQLPALLAARKMLRRSGPATPVDAEAALYRLRALAAADSDRQGLTDAVGDLLLAIVALADRLEIDAEDALRQALRRRRGN